MKTNLSARRALAALISSLVPLMALEAQESSVVTGAIDARLMRQPDVSATQIAFVYAGDIWVVPKTGGTATRLSSPRGEEGFPRFSPDGALIAFSGNYDGNQDLYVVPASGGLPRRLTYHGAPDRMLNWYPDGRHILFATSRTSARERFNQLYRISVEGGLPEPLPVPYGEFGAISPDGQQLAYTPISVDFRTWKRYRGGMNPDIWRFDLEKLTARNITHHAANDSQPMWHGTTLYFLSDRDAHQRNNLWAWDSLRDKFRQVTSFTDYDVTFPSVGPQDIVFENGGRLYLLDLATEKHEAVRIKVVTDRATLKPRAEKVTEYVHGYDVSPSGKRAVFEARGDLFTVPAEHGVVRNLTHSPGVAERHPTWSPDGKRIAYFTDRSGEYELAIQPADGSGKEETFTSLGPGFRYRPTWSPDGKKIVFIDQAMKVQLHDLDVKKTTVIDRQLWAYQGELNRFAVGWSADSRWVAYDVDLENRNSAIVLYDTQEGKRHQVTAGFYNDSRPVFDPDGKYLYFLSGRNFDPVYSELDETWVYPNSVNIVAVPLRRDVPSPLAPRNDEEGDKDKKEKPEEKKAGEAGTKANAREHTEGPFPLTPAPSPGEREPVSRRFVESSASLLDPAPEMILPLPGGEGRGEGERVSQATADPPAEQKDEAKKEAAQKSVEKTESTKEKKPKPVAIDLPDFERRAVVLPPKPGRYADLAVVSGKVIYRRLPRAGSAEEKSPVVFYDLEKREEKTILDDADDAILAAKGDKLLVRKKADYAIIDVKEAQKMDKKLATAGLEATVDPVAEWRQIFTDAWRFERDYFYDPHLHGVDWEKMRVRYGRLLTDCVTRWDVNYVIGELIAELNASHTYRSGGDVEPGEQRGVGYLGCDYLLENGAYRIQKILDGAAWDAEVRSPLRQPGVTNVQAGDYLLAVNGVPLDTSLEPAAAFQGLADKPVFLTVNDKPTRDGAREVLVHTLASEARLRNLVWIESNRQRVEKATEGQVGYVYVPDTGRGGQTELVRQFRGQFNKAGLIIDERFNSGGQIPDRFVEMLGRRVINYWGVRDGKDWSWPPTAHDGPMAMLINGWSGSGGDCFPYYFKKAGLGPLIGMRTWGGLIGMTGVPPLIDNGSVTVPTFGIYNTQGEWIIEGYGVDPDIEVVDDPGRMAKGADPQLERAMDEVLKALKKNPPREVKKPKYPMRALQ